MAIFGRLKANKAQVASTTEPRIITEADYIEVTSGVMSHPDTPLSEAERIKFELALKANFGY